MTLYRYGLDDQLFLQNGRLAEGIFLNICVLGAQAKEQEWVLQFIQLYEPHLRLRFKRETLALSRAFLAFHAGDFLEAERQLRDVTSTDLVYRLRIHSLSVRCLLESVLLNISFYHALSSKVRAFKRVIQAKNRLPSAREEAYLNFADVVQGIANFKKGPNSGQQAFLELQEKIQSLSPLVLKAWLSEKLQQVHPKSP